MRNMEYHNLSFDKRISENIKNYSLHKLYDLERIKEYLARLSALCGAEYLLTTGMAPLQCVRRDLEGKFPMLQHVLE